MVSLPEYIEGHALLRLQPIISTSECSPAAGTNAAPEINGNSARPREGRLVLAAVDLRIANTQALVARVGALGEIGIQRHQPGITLVALFQHRDDIEGAPRRQSF